MVEAKCEGEGSPTLVGRRSRWHGGFRRRGAAGEVLGGGGGDWERFGGVWGVVDQLLTPIPFLDPSELPRPEFPALATGVSGPSQRFRC